MLTEIYPPDIGGWTLLELLRNRWPALPAVVFTSQTNVDLVKTAIALGPADYLNKGIATAELVHRVRLVLENSLSVFISYSHVDQLFADQLCARLTEAGLHVWYAPKDMRGGGKIYEQIERAVQTNDKLLLVLSEGSMNSEWVAAELYHARQRELREGRRVLRVTRWFKPSWRGSHAAELGVIWPRVRRLVRASPQVLL